MTSTARFRILERGLETGASRSLLLWHRAARRFLRRWLGNEKERGTFIYVFTILVYFFIFSFFQLKFSFFFFFTLLVEIATRVDTFLLYFLKHNLLKMNCFSFWSRTLRDPVSVFRTNLGNHPPVLSGECVLKQRNLWCVVGYLLGWWKIYLIDKNNNLRKLLPSSPLISLPCWMVLVILNYRKNPFQMRIEIVRNAHKSFLWQSERTNPWANVFWP